MSFKQGAIVYWKLNDGSYLGVQNIPTEFVVINPGYKYCTLRSRKLNKKGFAYRDLEKFDMSKLVLVSEVQSSNSKETK